MRTNLYYLAGTLFLLLGGIMFLSSSTSFLQFIYLIAGICFMATAMTRQKKEGKGRR
ncbi:MULTISPECIES: hypothetical protein [Bacillaceae]|uniref:hypothetical protein n=1 Tax=Shouchella oshimensis TaxID=290588 RepID=UPI000A5EB67B|nr:MULTISPECIES: hypothetical protein [Bacillaceae]